METFAYPFSDADEVTDLLDFSRENEAFIACFRGTAGSFQMERWVKNEAVFSSDLFQFLQNCEFDSLFNSPNGILKDLETMRRICDAYPPTDLSDTKNMYAFPSHDRYFFYEVRCCPHKIQNNFYIFCYQLPLLRKNFPLVESWLGCLHEAKS